MVLFGQESLFFFFTEANWSQERENRLKNIELKLFAVRCFCTAFSFFLVKAQTNHFANLKTWLPGAAHCASELQVANCPQGSKSSAIALSV